MQDSVEEQICEWFDRVVEFIKEALDKDDTKVLVRIGLLRSYFVGTNRGASRRSTVFRGSPDQLS